MRTIASIAALFSLASCASTGDLERKYHDNGELLCEGRKVDGLREGQWRFFHENGKPHSTSTYSKGRRVGVWHRWFSNGQLLEKSEWNGTHHGLCERWGGSGNKELKGRYEHGNKTGHWDFWNPDGSINENLTGTYGSGRKKK